MRSAAAPTAAGRRLRGLRPIDCHRTAWAPPSRCSPRRTSVVPEPKLTTFGGPRPGLHDFVVPFNLLIDSCFRVVNLFDIVPHLPLALPGLPYEHVGVQVAVNSGGSIDQTHRHSLDTYRARLTSLISTQPAWAA